MLAGISHLIARIDSPCGGSLPERETQKSSLRSSKLLFVFFLNLFSLGGDRQKLPDAKLQQPLQRL